MPILLTKYLIKHAAFGRITAACPKLLPVEKTDDTNTNPKSRSTYRPDLEISCIVFYFYLCVWEGGYPF